MLDTLTNAIDVDVAFVLAGLLLGVAVLITGIAGHKRQNDHRSMFSSRHSSEVESLLAVGEAITFLAMLPATVYIVTRAFPGFYQQLIVSFIVIALFAGVKQTRIAVQIGVTVIVAIVISVVTFPVRIAGKILLYAYRKLRPSSPNGTDTDTDDTTDDTSTLG